MKKSVIAIAALSAAISAQAAIDVSSAAFTYNQSFDGLAASGGPITWVNDSTLPGWSLFVQNGNAAPTYAVDTGTSNGGSFKSFGASGNSDRALGGVGSSGTYFGTPGPAAGAIAGYLAAAFTNTSGGALGGFTIGFDGEQWRNGGPNNAGQTFAQPMVFEYGFGASFGAVSAWVSPGGSFDWSSPVFSGTSGAVNGNTTGRVAGVGGTVATPWAAGDTLWVRWTERNDFGNDHALAIDNLSLTVTPVPEPETYAMLLAGLAVLGGVARRRRA